jgi:hypothetical protein
MLVTDLRDRGRFDRPARMTGGRAFPTGVGPLVLIDDLIP